MKRSPDYFHNRKMLRQLSYDTPKFRPTVKDVEEWFDILNEQLFGNKLDPFGKISIKRHKRFHALFHYWPKRENRPTELTVYRKFRNKKLFVEILAHEMIHQYQWEVEGPRRMTRGLRYRFGHGKSFFRWRAKFNKFGIPLTVYGDHHSVIRDRDIWSL